MNGNRSSFSRLLVKVVFVAALGAMGWVAVTQVPFISAQFDSLSGAFQTSGGGGGGIGGVGGKIGGMWKGVGK